MTDKETLYPPTKEIKSKNVSDINVAIEEREESMHVS
jgi:hypothetical protein